MAGLDATCCCRASSGSWCICGSAICLYGPHTNFLLLQAQPSTVPSSFNPGNTSFAAAFTSNCQVGAGAGALLQLTTLPSACAVTGCFRRARGTMQWNKAAHSTLNRVRSLPLSTDSKFAHPLWQDFAGTGLRILLTQNSRFIPVLSATRMSGAASKCLGASAW